MAERKKTAPTAKDERTYTVTHSQMETFARLHAAFCSQHTAGGRLDQARDEKGVIDLKKIREQSGQLLAQFGVDPNSVTIHTPNKKP